MFEYFNPKPIVKESFWVMEKTDKYHRTYRCDNCKKVQRFRKTPYCPMCGFRMIEKEI